MKVMCFDLSSRCIGVITARINDNNKKVEKVLSCPVIPSFDPVSLGFLHSKKKLPIKNGQLLNTYAYPGETSITKTEKDRRDKFVREKKNTIIMQEIGKNLGNLLDNILPNIVIAEKNAIFNGILTSVLLGEVMGVLEGLSGRLSIPVEKYPVNKVRSIYNVSKLVLDFTAGKNEEELKKIPDITKRALRELMTKKYGVVFQTDDESDACVVFDYWYETKFMGD